MKRWVIIAAIPLVLLAGGIIAAKLYFTGERLRALVVPRIEEATRRSVTLGDISLAVFPSIGVEATGFRLSNPPGRTWPNPYFLSLDRLFVDVRLWPLISGKVEINKVVLDGLVVYLDVTKDGKKNYSFGGAAGAAKAEAETGTGSPGGFLLANLEVENGRIEAHNRRLDTRWTAAGLDQTLSAKSADDGTVLEISGKTGIDSFSYGSGSSWTVEDLPLTSEEDLLYRLGDDRLEFTKVDASVRDVPLKVSGSVSGLRAETMMVDLAIVSPELTLEKLLSLLPAASTQAGQGAGGVEATGTASFTASVKGRSNDNLSPGVRAEFRVSDGTIRYQSLPKSITGVAAEGVLDVPEGPVDAKGVGDLELKRFAATLGGSSIAGHMTVNGFGNPAVKGALKTNLALGEVGQYYPLEPGTKLGGAVTADVTIDGRPSDPRSIKASGTATFRDVSYASGASAPITGISGAATFNNQAVELKGMSLGIGSSHLRLDATIRNYLSMLFDGDGKAAAKPFLNFALSAKTLNTMDFSSPEGDAPARGAPNDDGKEKAASMFPAIDLAGTVDVETLRTKKFTFTNAKGSLAMNGGVMKLTSMRLDAFGGNVEADGSLDLSKPDARPFDLELNINSVESNELLSPFTRFGKYLFGDLNLATSVRGSLDDTLGIDISTLSGAGDALVQNGRLTGVPLLQKLSAFVSLDELKELDFKNWSQSFSIADGKLNVKDLKIGAKDADLTVNGVYGLDGAIDYGLRLTLPKTTSDKVKLQGVADQLIQFFRDKEGRLNLDFRVGGRADAPTLSLDTRAQEAALKQKLLDEAGKKLTDPLKKIFQKPKP